AGGSCSASHSTVASSWTTAGSRPSSHCVPWLLPSRILARLASTKLVPEESTDPAAFHDIEAMPELLPEFGVMNTDVIGLSRPRSTAAFMIDGLAECEFCLVQRRYEPAVAAAFVTQPKPLHSLANEALDQIPPSRLHVLEDQKKSATRSKNTMD